MLDAETKDKIQAAATKFCLDAGTLECLLVRTAKKLPGADFSPRELKTAFEAAAEEDRAFVVEMWDGKTERSQLAREALCKSVYDTARKTA